MRVARRMLTSEKGLIQSLRTVLTVSGEVFRERVLERFSPSDIEVHLEEDTYSLSYFAVSIGFEFVVVVNHCRSTE